MYQRSIDSTDRGKSISSLCQFLIRFSISREANGDILYYLPSSFPPTPPPNGMLIYGRSRPGGGRHWGSKGSCSITPSLWSPPMLKPSVLSVKPSFATIQSKLIDWRKVEICPTNVYVHSLMSLLPVSLINCSSGVFSASTTFLQYGLQNRQVNLLYRFRATHLA